MHFSPIIIYAVVGGISLFLFNIPSSIAVPTDSLIIKRNTPYTHLLSYSFL